MAINCFLTDFKKKCYSLFTMFSLGQNVLVLLFANCLNAVRVCPSFGDYFVLANPNCYDNPESNMNVTQVISHWGFTSKEYFVTTDDGYILPLARGFRGSKSKKRTPIVIGHGINVNSLSYCMLTNNSMAYQLMDRGYDVWLINFRGTQYSLGHINMTSSNRKYWEFSFDEMGRYDLPTVLNYVLSTTKDKAIYMGHSMGTSVGFVYTSTMPQHSTNHVKGMIYMAPVSYFIHSRTLARLLVPIAPILRALGFLIFGGKLPAFHIVKVFCASSPLSILFCETVKMTFAGFDYSQLDWEHLPLIQYMWPDGFPIDILAHYAQIIRSNKFQNYDYGTLKNLKIYKQLNPPVYPLSKISVPTSLFSAMNDDFSSVEDGAMAYNEIKSKYRCGHTVLNYTRFNHLDFIQAKDVNSLLYNDVFQKVADLDEGICN